MLVDDLRPSWDDLTGTAKMVVGFLGAKILAGLSSLMLVLVLG